MEISLLFSDCFQNIVIIRRVKMIRRGSKPIQLFLFQGFFRLNKIELNSLLVVSLVLLIKCICGAYLVMMIFFADSAAQFQLTDKVKSILTIELGQGDNHSMVVEIVFSLLNLLNIFLLFVLLSKQSSNLVNKIIVIVLQALQAFKFLSAILICTQIKYGLTKGNFLLVILNVINLLLVLLWNVLSYNFYHTSKYSTKNLLAKFHSSHLNLMEAALVGLTVAFTLIGPQSVTSNQKMLLNLSFLLVKISIIYVSLLKWYYLDRTVQYLHSFLATLEIVALLANLILQFTNQNLLKSNFYECVLPTAVFCFLAWKSYFNWTQQDHYFCEGKDIKGQNNAIMYFKALYDISSQGNLSRENSVILSSIRKKHEVKCRKAKCYCKVVKEDLDFVKQYTLQQLDSIRQNFKGQPNILFQQLNFRFHMYQAYPQVLTRLQKIQNKFGLSLVQEFIVFTLKMQLRAWISQRNLVNNLIEAESPLRLEEITKQMDAIIKKDIEVKSKKWNYLSRGLCRLEDLEQKSKEQTEFLKQINRIHSQWILKFKRSSLFNILLMFYYTKVSFLSVNIEDVLNNLREQMRKIKEEELSSTKEFAKYIFHKRSCVIESLIDEEIMGTVTRSSKNVFEMFGYHSNEIKGMNLNKLMPIFMAAEHDLILSEWVKIGTWRTVGKLKEIFCIHKAEFCFSALLYLKVMANQKGLFFATVVFKKNQSDYLILNPRKQIQGIGRKFLHMIGNNCRKLPISILVDDFPTLQKGKNFQYKSFTRTFKSLKNNQHIVDEFLQTRTNHFSSEEQQKLFINQYQHKLISAQDLEKWEVNFNLKIYKMREVHFYVILLNYAKVIRHSSRTSLQAIQNGKFEVIFGNGKINQEEQSEIASSNNVSQLTIDGRNSKFYNQKNSSLASFAEHQSFTLNKLLRTFYQFLINPQQIKDARIDKLNISTLLKSLILTGIISFSFAIYTNSLHEIGSYISANASINQNMQLAILMYNKVVSISEYEDDKQTLKRFLAMSNKDISEFHATMKEQLRDINYHSSELHDTHLYDYLKLPVAWIYQKGKSVDVEAIQFLQYYYYMTYQMSQDAMQGLVAADMPVSREYELYRIKQNFPRLKTLSLEISEFFILETQKNIRDLFLVALLTMTSFSVITLLFFLYSYKYHKFRYAQKYQCLQIYKVIPIALMERVKQYYQSFYTQLLLSKQKYSSIQGHLDNLNRNQLSIEGTTNTTPYNNKMKFFGKEKSYSWIVSLGVFFVINVVNIMITYQVIAFTNPLGSFVSSINSIMDAQNKLMESYLDIKGEYLLAITPEINTATIDNLLSLMAQNQVTFNKMVTFESETLNKYDPQFYSDFYKILLDNICEQTQDMLDPEQYKDCMLLSKGGIMQNGIITYMNSFQRKLRSVLEDLKVNSVQRFATEGRDYFINRGFKHVDLTISYSIKIFRKLLQRILQGYIKGVQYVGFVNTVVLVLSIFPQLIGIVMWFQLAKREKIKLSFLYGSILMIPPIIVKQVKQLPRMAKKILQYSQK